MTKYKNIHEIYVSGKDVSVHKPNKWVERHLDEI